MRRKRYLRPNGFDAGNWISASTSAADWTERNNPETRSIVLNMEGISITLLSLEK